MRERLRQLTQDHRELEKLLVSLERLAEQAGLLSLKQLKLLATTVNDLQHDRVQEHHALEDATLELLRSYERITDEMIDTLHSEHEYLDQLAEQVTSTTQHVLKNRNANSLAEIGEQLTAFTTAYREHIQFEEEIVFPVIEQIILEHSEKLL